MMVILVTERTVKTMMNVFLVQIFAMLMPTVQILMDLTTVPVTLVTQETVSIVLIMMNA